MENETESTVPWTVELSRMSLVHFYKMILFASSNSAFYVSGHTCLPIWTVLRKIGDTSLLKLAVFREAAFPITTIIFRQIELDKSGSDQVAILECLGSRYGRKMVPIVFIDGGFVGGLDQASF